MPSDAMVISELDDVGKKIAIQGTIGIPWSMRHFALPAGIHSGNR